MNWYFQLGSQELPNPQLLLPQTPQEFRKKKRACIWGSQLHIRFLKAWSQPEMGEKLSAVRLMALHSPSASGDQARALCPGPNANPSLTTLIRYGAPLVWTLGQPHAWFLHLAWHHETSWSAPIYHTFNLRHTTVLSCYNLPLTCSLVSIYEVINPILKCKCARALWFNTQVGRIGKVTPFRAMALGFLQTMECVSAVFTVQLYFQVFFCNYAAFLFL